MRTKRRHEMRVRQEADVEQQIRVDRDAVLEPEAQDRDDELCAGGCAGRDPVNTWRSSCTVISEVSTT
jgi:hypothetical protein